MINQSKTDQLMLDLAFLLEKMKEDLERGGYIFDSSQDAFQPPSPATSLVVQKMKDRFGSFPYAIESFYTHVGSVDFCGSTKVFEESHYPDPIQLVSFDYYTRCYKEFLSSEEEREWWVEEWGGFALLMSADYYHKENVSGGPEYFVRIPAGGDDPLFEATPEQNSFLDYLALVLKYGGFPGYRIEDFALPPYYTDASIMGKSQSLSLRFSELAQECRDLGNE